MRARVRVCVCIYLSSMQLTNAKEEKRMAYSLFSPLLNPARDQLRYFIRISVQGSFRSRERERRKKAVYPSTKERAREKSNTYAGDHM